MQDDDEAFTAFERTMRPRSVLEAEQARAAKGHPPDEALLKHGGGIEEHIVRTLAREAEALRAGPASAEILVFPATPKTDGA